MTRILGKGPPRGCALEFTAHRSARLPLRSLAPGCSRRALIAEEPEPRVPVHGPTSTYWYLEPRAIPDAEDLRPNLRAGMSVGPRTRRQWRTPPRPLPSLFVDTFLIPPWD